MLEHKLLRQITLLMFYSIFALCQATFAEEAPNQFENTLSREDFLSYTDLNDFMEASPQATTLLAPESLDVMQYGPDVMKTLTGPDCNRDGKMDNLTSCRAEFLRLWLKFKD